MKDNLKKDIAIELRSLRAKKKISLEQLSKYVNIGKDTLCRYESEKYSIPFENLEKILNFYNINLVIFFTNVYDSLKNKNNKKQFKN